MAYKNKNSFDGKWVIFDNTRFKYEFKQYCDKGGFTQNKVLDDLSEHLSYSKETIKNWLKNTKPVDGIISENGKINEETIVVKLAKFFGIDVKNLLKFPQKEECEEMILVEEKVKDNVKYNTIQIEALKKLNDVVMEYMILKCHTMDYYANSTNEMEYFDYEKLVNEKFNTFQGVNEEDYKDLYPEKSEEQKKKTKEDEIEKLKMMKESYEDDLKNNYDNDLDIEITKEMLQEIEEHLQNIDSWMEKKEEQEKKDFPYFKKYNIRGEFASFYGKFIEKKMQKNSAYGYVLFEIEKASTLLRKSFVDNLLKLMVFLYDVYDVCKITEKEIAKKYFVDKDGKCIIIDFNNFHITNCVKELFSKEFSLYC